MRAAIGLETAENVFVTPAERGRIASRQAGATNMRVWNNFLWNYAGAAGSCGIAVTKEATTRNDFVDDGNRVENNTIFNQIAASSVPSRDLRIGSSGGSFRNNIIALASQTSNPAPSIFGIGDHRAELQAGGQLGPQRVLDAERLRRLRQQPVERRASRCRRRRWHGR